MLDAAERHAREHGHRVVIAVVERSGELVALRRTPGAQIASSRVAVDKARTAAIFVRPSRELEQQVSSGTARRARAARRPRTDGRHPAEGRRRGRRRDRHQRRDTRRGRGDLDRRRRAPSSRPRPCRRSPTPAHGAPQRPSRSECTKRGVAPVCAVVDAGGELAVSVAARGGAGGKRRRRDRQGPDRRDLPPPEQGLRGAGRRRTGVGASPRARGAAPGRHPDRPSTAR